tara:strand:- start:108 stop:3113 length:3006 start_codon:yes stop_codon:yes gene_type:complete
MNNLPFIVKSLRAIPFLQNLGESEIEKIASSFSKEFISMGEPIAFSEKIPDSLLVLIEGEVRQLINHPRNGNTFTLSRYKPNYVIGLSSYRANVPLEFITAATDCTFLKISIKDWQGILTNFPNLLDELPNNEFLSEIWAILSKQNKVDFPKDFKDIRSWVMYLSKNSEFLSISKSDQIQLEKLDSSKSWFAISKNNNFPFGSKIEFDSFDISSLEENLSYSFLGIPTILIEREIDSLILRPNDLDTHNSLTNDSSTLEDTNDKNINSKSKKSKPDQLKYEKYPFYSSPKDPILEAVACFRIIGSTLDLPIKVDLIRRSFVENIDIKKTPINLQLCAAISESIGLKSQLLELPIALIERVQTPALLQLKTNELAVLLEIRDGNLLIARPSLGLKTYKINDLESIHSDQEKLPILILRTTERTPRKKFGLKWFLPAIKKNRKPLIEVLIASFFVQLLQLMNPLIIQQLIDKVIGQNGINTLPALAILLFTFSIFENLLTAVRTNLFIDTTNRIDISLGEQVIDHLLRLPLPFFDKRPVGELSSRIGELEQIRNFLTGTALTVVLDSVFSIVYIAVMILYSWILTIVALLVAPLLGLITFSVSPIIRRQLRSKAELNANTQNHLVEILTGIQTVKAQNFELKARWKWKERYSKYISESFRNTITSTTSNSFTQFLNQSSSLSVLCVGTFLVLDGKLTLGQLIAFRIISGYVTGPLLRLSNLYQNFQQTNISLERLSDIINTPQESTDLDKKNIPMPLIAGDVSFKNVSFRFQNKGNLNLSNINLNIKSGQFVAVVGESGSGKSTLTKLLARLYDPLEGQIKIDNIEISKVELYSLRRQIGIVPQDSILFDGSVQENIALSNSEATVEEIVKAAKIASAHEFIMGLPSGYASSVGERGSNLSGGQRQRIAIARSILQNPNMLIMDESTSALDFETERKVSLNLMQFFRGKTVLFITHRLNSIVHSDMIFTMHQGRLEESGTHEELMSLRGRYYSLFKQQERYEN